MPNVNNLAIERNAILTGFVDRAIDADEQLRSYRKITNGLYMRVPVRSRRGNFFERNRAFGADVDIQVFRRASGTGVKYISTEYTEVTGWALSHHTLGWAIDKHDALGMAAPDTDLDIHRDSMLEALIDLERARAKAAIDLATNTAVVTNTASLTLTQIDDVSTDLVGPTGVILTQKIAFKAQTGIHANRVTMNTQAAQYLVSHPQAPEFFSRTAPSLGRLTDALDEPSMLEPFVAALWGVPFALVLDAQYNTANLGQTEVISYMIDDDIIMDHVAPTMAPNRPMSAFVRFQGDFSARIAGEEVSWEEGDVFDWVDPETNAFKGRYGYHEHIAAPRPARARILTDVY